MICGMLMGIETSTTSIPKGPMEKRTDSVNDRRFELIKGQGAHVNKSWHWHKHGASLLTTNSQLGSNQVVLEARQLGF